ncbi:MAG: 2-amino-4-hydroxy-6-hydroxymethyldihydropteridine diphosphokinase HppK [Idiomarinaceae bacterium HL-53]|nr:MAG: 2-amino-4-hydroxy-6-hydroxymethyldihydropteridine diphosphokinase HppK [Idiomarinaceae bacterium HL-53]CUS48620.1 2-amino-4-hydroxy-6-hydroxymethyldihydropteridinediphosphokinase [Idiomarinaceae bacterium HL-53]
MSWYYLSLGANLEPEQHLGDAIEALVERFAPVFLSPVVRTQPCDIETDKYFLNAVMVFWSNLSGDELKTWFNELEAQAGRDRSDPLKSKKDRPLDIDILANSEVLNLDAFQQSSEPYTRICIEAAEGKPAAVQTLAIFEGLTSDRATTIDTNHRGGHVFVVENRPDRLLKRLETALHSK